MNGGRSKHSFKWLNMRFRRSVSTLLAAMLVFMWLMPTYSLASADFGGDDTTETQSIDVASAGQGHDNGRGDNEDDDDHGDGDNEEHDGDDGHGDNGNGGGSGQDQGNDGGDHGDNGNNDGDHNDDGNGDNGVGEGQGNDGNSGDHENNGHNDGDHGDNGNNDGDHNDDGNGDNGVGEGQGNDGNSGDHENNGHNDGDHNDDGHGDNGVTRRDTPTMSITKTDSVDPISLNDDTIYTITVTNTGTEKLKDVEVTDNLPDGLEYVAGSASPAPSQTTPKLKWDLDDIDEGDFAVITLTVKGKTEGVHTNEAKVKAKDADDKSIYEQTTVNAPTNGGGGSGDDCYDGCDEDNCEECADDCGDDCDGQCDDDCDDDDDKGMTITKTVSSDQILIGENTTYTITVTNTGEGDLEDVDVTDNLPDGVLYGGYSFPPANVSVLDPELTWHFDKIDEGDSKEITVVVTGALASPEPWINHATADACDLDPQAAEAPTTVNYPYEPPQETSYTITKSDALDPVIVGQNTTYTITFTNTGNTTIYGAEIHDEMPAGLEYVSSSPNPEETSPLYWLPNPLAPGESYVITVVAKAVAVGQWTNTARAQVYRDESEAYAYEATGVLAAPEPESTKTPPPLLPPAALPETFDLSISKTDNVDPAYVGDTITYTITVKNKGDQPLTGLILKDTLAGGMAFKGSNVSDMDAGSGVLAWGLVSLGVGQTRSFRVSLTAKKAGNWLNTVTVRANELPTARQASERTRVLARLAAAPATSDANPTSGGTLPFTGFETWTWFLVASMFLVAGLALEVRTRKSNR